MFAWKRLARCVRWICLCASAACASGIAPETPRIARGAGYELELGAVRGGPNPQLDAERQLALRVIAVPPRTRVLTVSVQASAQPPCSGGVMATKVRVPGDAWTQRRRPKPGETLLVDLPGPAWKLATQESSRLDVVLRDADGALQCASFPLIGAGPELRWKLLESWMASGLFQYDVFLDRVAGIDSASSFGVAVGKWLGPVRLSMGAGAGVSWCVRAGCAADLGDSPHIYYVPTFAGFDTTLLQVGRLALEIGAQYKLAWTEARTSAGERPVLLHGPELIPRIAWALPDPIAPGIPGGPRRGYAISFGVPVGYVMATRGDASLSVGGALLVSVPIR